MAQAEKINTKELADTLEPMIRRVVREELLRVLREDRDIFHLTPEMPLYEDMEDSLPKKYKKKYEEIKKVYENKDGKYQAIFDNIFYTIKMLLFNKEIHTPGKL